MKAIELAPHVKQARSFHAYCLAMSGELTQSRAEFGRFWSDPAQAPPGDVAPLTARDHALGERVLTKLRATTGEGSYYQFAQVFAQMGKKEEAIKALNEAWAVRDPGLTMTLIDPLLDPLRADPRFQSLFRTLDFPT